jgi:hypothetical protein
MRLNDVALDSDLLLLASMGNAGAVAISRMGRRKGRSA